MSEKRIAKLIASRGLASRREAEVWVAEGRVTVDGKVVTEPGFKVDAEVSEVRVDNKALPAQPPLVYYLLHKPRGYITGREDPRGRKSILELIDHLVFRVEPVGRLDFDTEGVLILTNDGDLANALSHPSLELPRRYRAKVYRTPDAADIKAIETGVFLDDGRTKPAKARVLEATSKENAWLEITVTEGKNRLIRRMMAQLGHPVSKLSRVSFASVALGKLERGGCRALTPTEVRRLKDLSEGRKPGSTRKKKGKGFAKAKPKPKRIAGRKKRRAAKLRGSKSNKG